MKGVWIIVAGLASGVWSQAPTTPADIDDGKAVYLKRCAFCHGEGGDGNGPVAKFLWPRPRNFTLGAFKIRSTPSGELPTDQDLFETLGRGLPGSSMQHFNNLSDAEKRRVVAYLKTFFGEFYDPAAPPKTVEIGIEPKETAETIRKGGEIYEKQRCLECHGRAGRGDGTSAPTLKDDEGFRIRPRDLGKPWHYRGGSSARDIYLRLTTGMSGAPMPSFVKTLKDEERWQLAHYVRSLQVPPERAQGTLLKAARVEGVPSTPGDSRWNGVPSLGLALAGQVIARPRWQNFSIDYVEVQALYDEKRIALRVLWNDPTRNTEHSAKVEKEISQGKGNYPEIDPSQPPPGPLRDSLALQFPDKIPDGPEKPHFFLGDPSHPVNLWLWRSDQGQAEEVTAAGFKSPWKPHEAQSQLVKSSAAYSDGQWRLVLTRDLDTGKGEDSRFAAGRMIPFSVLAWDGGNGEAGRRQSLSSWAFLLLEPPTSMKVYFYPATFGLAVAGLELFLLRRIRRRTRASKA